MRITIYTRNDCVQLPVVIAGDLSWSGFRPDMINRLHPAPHAASA